MPFIVTVSTSLLRCLFAVFCAFSPCCLLNLVFPHLLEALGQLSSFLSDHFILCYSTGSPSSCPDPHQAQRGGESWPFHSVFLSLDGGCLLSYSSFLSAYDQPCHFLLNSYDPLVIPAILLHLPSYPCLWSRWYFIL